MEKKDRERRLWPDNGFQNAFFWRGHPHPPERMLCRTRRWGCDMDAIAYRLIRSNRRTVSIQITPQGEVVVRCPRRAPAGRIQAFVESKRGWIEKNLAKLAEKTRMPALSAEELQALADQAARYIPERTAYFAPKVGVRYGRVTIRSQRTRWGSCSAQGNLNFNCLLMLAPRDVLDYVVVHELCHRKQMNHAPEFWAEVERVLPQYKNCRKWLKENGNALIARLPSGNT